MIQTLQSVHSATVLPHSDKGKENFEESFSFEYQSSLDVFALHFDIFRSIPHEKKEVDAANR